MPYTRVLLADTGGPEQLVLDTVDALPEPLPGQVRVRVLVTSVAFTDVMIRKGLYPGIEEKPPFVPGYDMVGIVDALGVGVAGLEIGSRVADLTTVGSYAQWLCLPAENLTPVPQGIGDEDALAMILSGVTAYQLIHRVAHAKPGSKVLVHGAGGAVGTMLLQLAREAGLTAFGTDREDKHDLIRHFGATPIDAEAQDLEAAMRQATGDGVDYVFDPLGADSFEHSLHALRPGGMLIAFGFQNEVMGKGGSIPLDFVKLKVWDWLPNGHATAFYSIGAMRRQHPKWFKSDLEALFALLAAGRLDPAIAQIMPLAEVREAHRLVEAGDVKGKLVMRVSDR